MGKTTNILDLNNRLTKVEKEKVAQNSYTSLKNKPKINSVTLTGNKTLAEIGAAAAADVGDLSALTTTDKSSCVGAINEVNWAEFYTISNATDVKDFIKKLIIQVDADLANKPLYRIYPIFSVYQGVENFVGTIKRLYTHSYCFTLNEGSGSAVYCGYFNIEEDHLSIYSYSGTVVS